MDKINLNKYKKLLNGDFKFLIELFVLTFGFFGSIDGVFSFIKKINELKYEYQFQGINILNLNEKIFIKIYLCLFLYLISMIILANIFEILKHKSTSSTTSIEENNLHHNANEEDYISKMNKEFKKTKIRKAIFTFGISLIIATIKNFVFKNKGIASIDVFDKPKHWTDFDNNHVEKDIVRYTSANIINNNLLINKVENENENITHIEPKPIIGYEFRFTKTYDIIMRQTSYTSKKYGDWLAVSPFDNYFLLFISPWKWFRCVAKYLFTRLIHR